MNIEIFSETITIIFNETEVGDALGLIFFTFIIIGLSITSIFAAKWYIWGPKWKAKKMQKKEDKKVKGDGGANLSAEEKQMLKKTDSELNSQQLLIKHRAETKIEKALKVTENKKIEKLEDKESTKQEKEKYKQISREQKTNVKTVKKSQKKNK